MSSTLVKNQSSLFLVKEVTEGVHVDPTLDSHGVEPLSDGTEFKPQFTEIERNTLTNTIEAVESRVGRINVTGSIGFELKASGVPGVEPRGGVMYEALFGGKRVISAQTVSGVGHTTTRIHIPDSAFGRYKKNDVLLVKDPGKYAVRPILVVDETPGAGYIDFVIPFSVAPADAAVIEKVVVYHHDSPEISIAGTYFDGGEIREKIPGIKPVSAAIDGWEVDKTPSIKFDVQASDLLKDLATPTVTPDFSNDAKVPVILGALAWLGQESVDYNKLALSFDNSAAPVTSAARASGRIGTRKTKFGAKGGIDPYMTSDNLDRWNSFRLNQATSLFTYAFNGTGVDGEFKDVVAIWIPNVKITNMPAKDQDGVLQDDIEIKAFRKGGKDTAFLAFI